MKDVDFQKIYDEMLAKLEKSFKDRETPMDNFALTLNKTILVTCRAMLERYHQEISQD